MEGSLSAHLGSSSSQRGPAWSLSWRTVQTRGGGPPRVTEPQKVKVRAIWSWAEMTDVIQDVKADHTKMRLLLSHPGDIQDWQEWEGAWCLSEISTFSRTSHGTNGDFCCSIINVCMDFCNQVCLSCFLRLTSQIRPSTNTGPAMTPPPIS